MRIDEFIPSWDVCERFEHRVEAPAEIVMRVAYDFDMQSIFLIRAIVNARKFILGGTKEVRRPIG